MSLTASKVSLRLGNCNRLSAVDCCVTAGQMTALIGPNGAGKTSLLKTFSGEILPSQGQVYYDDEALPHIDLPRRALKRSVMQQSSQVVFDFTVNEVLSMGWVQGSMLPPDSQEQALAWAVRACDLTPLLPRAFNTLSGGEQQRVQFARALLQIWRPDAHGEDRYILLDEPTANLDIAHQLSLLNLLRATLTSRVGVLIVLHDLNLAARFADQLVLLKDGAVVDAGPVGDVLSSEQLSAVYGTQVFVERHQLSNRLVVYW